MDWLRDFQQSFREPVYGFLGTFWPVLAVAALIGLGWLFGSMVTRTRRDGSASGGSSAFSIDDSDGDGGGGDGGGGD